MPRRLGVLALLILPLAACREAAPAADVLAVTDSAGVRISFARVDTLGPICPVTETLRIGSVEGDAGSALSGVFDAQRLPDGRIAVINAFIDRVKLFSADGALLTELGRRGDGPGEFPAQIWYVTLRGDTLVVGHRAPWLFSFFAADGTFLRRVTLEPRYMDRPEFSTALPSGSGFLVLDRSLSPSLDETRFMDVVAPLLRYTEEGVLTDTVGTFWTEQLGWTDRELRYVGGPIFGARAAFEVLGREEIVYAPAREAQLEIRGLDGSLRRIVRWQARDRAVRAADAEEWKRATRARIEANLVPRGADRPTIERVLRRETSDERPVADSFPAHDGIQLSQDDGRIWLKEFRRPFDEGPDRWLVFEGDGRFVCNASLPAGHTLHDAGRGWVLGRETDELDVEYVVQYRVDPPAATS